MGTAVAVDPVADEVDGVGALPAAVVLAHAGEGAVAGDDAVHLGVTEELVDVPGVVVGGRPGEGGREPTGGPVGGALLQFGAGVPGGLGAVAEALGDVAVPVVHHPAAGREAGTGAVEGAAHLVAGAGRGDALQRTEPARQALPAPAADVRGAAAVVLEEAVEHLDPGGRQPLGLVAQAGDAAGAVGLLAAVVRVLDVQPDQRQPAARVGVGEDAVQHAVEAGPESVLAGRGTVVPGAPLVRVPPGADVDLDGVGTVADSGVHPVEGVHPVRDGVDRAARVGRLRGGRERGGPEDRAQRRHQGGHRP